ncbi:pH-sensitive chloride channel 2-like [Macrosteles quadrilineatus]|uniref:pH-sensitive chloride channel 2-like n=1 Tax=Macrosteles quadrilineatus TaxID=74068 RepID=UPI0023E0AECA|nr:pH-sensitive chloride channel 2-like [Macrosteles quadrilineatus]
MNNKLSPLTSLCFYAIVTTGTSVMTCSALKVDDTTSVSQLISLLTDTSHYDVMVRPTTQYGGPLLISSRVHVYYLQMSHSTKLQFKLQMLVQFRWHDDRLMYKNISSLAEIVGQDLLLEKIWFPHVFVSTEQQSRVMDQTVSILPSGDVLYSRRLQTLLTCQVEEGKFPFDQQTCHLVMDNWRYNLSVVILEWDSSVPVVVLPSVATGLSEFNLNGLKAFTSTNQTTSDTFITSVDNCDKWNNDKPKGDFEDVHTCGIRKSSLIVTFYFDRKFGFYFWDYYGPSVLLVITSWGTFWVHPEVVPCRIWLATCTMLGLFGLGAMNDAMPKLSHLKMNDIWFIGCNLFIFLSLAEFAFVNIVHRQETSHVPLKRASSKYILKSSLRSERVAWKRKALSCPSSPELRQRSRAAMRDRRMQQKNVAFDLAVGDYTSDKKVKRRLMQRRQAFAGIHMTNHEMAHWIDRRSRIIFPTAFLVFNLLFWFIMFV